MTTRIKYKKTNDPQVLRSIHNFTSVKGFTYYVKLYPSEPKFEILNAENHNVIRAGGNPPKNLNVIKRNIKKNLEELGVEFKKEIRDRTFGICEKGYTEDKHSRSSEIKTTDFERIENLKKVGL